MISDCVFKMTEKLIYLTFLFLLSFPLNAEYKKNVHSISRQEGLSNGAVNTIVKDAEGYIWFGTWNGLNRYDGSNIVTYLPGNNPNSIHNNVIRELYPCSSGPIWMFTNKGLALYDNIHDRFTSYFTKESEQINYENDIAISHSDIYGTLASVFGNGIFRFDTVTMQFKSKKSFSKMFRNPLLSILKEFILRATMHTALQEVIRFLCYQAIGLKKLCNYH